MPPSRRPPTSRADAGRIGGPKVARSLPGGKRQDRRELSMPPGRALSLQIRQVAARRKLSLPTLEHERPRAITWRRPTYRMVLSMVRSPFYAGAYAFGRRVEHAAAALRPRAAPVHRAGVAFLHVGRRRREAVDTDAVAHEVHGRRAREVEQPSLARAIADVAGLALVAGRGHDHDDAAARRVFDHEAGDVLGAEEGTGEIHGELAVPALELHLEHALAAEDAGVVDEDVDAEDRL